MIELVLEHPIAALVLAAFVALYVSIAFFHVSDLPDQED